MGKKMKVMLGMKLFSQNKHTIGTIWNLLAFENLENHNMQWQKNLLCLLVTASTEK